MLRSLYSGISGMKANQVKLDVVGNNVSNVGTTGFKFSRVRFQDMLSQNQKASSAPSRTQGGVNPGQVGLGVQVSGIDTIVTQGMMQPTGRNLDVAMDGSGYFMVATGPLPKTSTGGVTVDNKSHKIVSSNDMAISYSRDGALALDKDGNLLTSDGYRVLGYVVSEQGGLNGDARSVNYGAGGVCEYVNADTEEGLKVSTNLVPMRIPDSVVVNATPEIPETDGVQLSYTGSVSTTEDPPIVSTNNKFVGTEDLKIEVRANGTGKDFDYYVNGKLIKTSGEDSITFYVDNNGNVTPDSSGSGTGTTETAIKITKPKEDREGASYEYNISAEGNKKIRNFFVEKDGLIKGVLEDGRVSVLGQLAVSSFKNAEGLQKLGKNLYTTSSNSGEPIVRSGIGAEAKFDNSDGYGDVLNGVLEMSNVELTEQFTEMIVTTRAFQASSKMISTGDEILQEIINLKR